MNEIVKQFCKKANAIGLLLPFSILCCSNIAIGQVVNSYLNPYANSYNNEQRRIPDYRKVSWGMTQQQVSMIEGEQVVFKVSESRIVCYNILIQNQVANLDYLFEKGRLVEAIVWFQVSGNDPVYWIRNYQQINIALKRKYGAPYHQDIKRTVKNAHSDAGAELITGKSFYTATWFFKNTKAVHSLGQANGIRNLLTYSSADYARRKQRKEQSLEDL